MVTTARLNKTRYASLLAAMIILLVLGLLGQVFWLQPALNQAATRLSAGLTEQKLWLNADVSGRVKRASLKNFVLQLQQGGAVATPLDAVEVPALPNQVLATELNNLVIAMQDGDDPAIRSAVETLNAGLLAQLQQKQLARLVFWLAISLGVVGLTARLVLGLRKALVRSEIMLSASQRENKTILEATKEGLFIVKPNHQVGSVQSQAVQTLFGIDEPIRGDFFEFLKRLISFDDLNEVRAHVTAKLAGSRVESSTVASQALNEIEIVTENNKGYVKRKYLSFEFARNEQNPAAGLLVTVSDVTPQADLKRELKELSRQNDERFQLLLGSVATQTAETKSFFLQTHQHLKAINDALRNSDQLHASHEGKMQEIKTAVNALKQQAAEVGNVLLETSAQAFEVKVDVLLEASEVSSEQIVNLGAPLKQMIAELDILEKLSARLGVRQATTPALSVVSQPQGVPSNARTSKNDELSHFAQAFAASQQKQASLVLSGFDEDVFQPQYKPELIKLFQQLVENAVMHSLEVPNERLRAGKAATGVVTIQRHDSSQSEVRFSVQDDGAGIDFDAIKQAAVSRGILTKEVSERLSKNELVRLVFISGFSTAATQADEPEQGMGLERVKAALTEMGGKIGIGSPDGVRAQFMISLPTSVLRSSSTAQQPASV
ncbi:hypothetical protein GCM10008090_03300 [Arenicella chitinivorans]|uniref:histidine kinase n=1 Tax=Arenicella chitinivorans TaxID=1329800 RepID=A0A918RGQ5_9GAMM|nr:ATP-binding protein [Arenicella chitinivorans]GGZ98235.1 hypothetical protein GCM10008090_03300 [Arenicella chitinivorans]